MTDQLVINSLQYTQVIGTFFDAKHQLETQRLLQVLEARAHKDYQPSENLCSFGTMTQSLARASRSVEFTSTALAGRSINRQVFTGEGIGAKGGQTDEISRLQNYIKNFCDPADESRNLDYLCRNGDSIDALYNRDISFAQNLQKPMTLDIDLTDGNTVTGDENALFALNDNLIGNDLFPVVGANKLVDPNDNPDYENGAQKLLNARAVVAKRSVAVNSIAAITALKAQSNDQSQPFIYALIKKMGGDAVTVEEIRAMIGENPSYYAQMKVLSKLYYQRPEFFVDLYDKPANIARMNAAIQAATLMRKRDLYRSYLRSEMTLAVMLEIALQEEIDLVDNEISTQIGGAE